jgi:DNA-binding CsgD family transcriptional regulator
MRTDDDNGLGAAMADALDALKAGIFLVDAEGRIVHCNTAGHAMLAAGDAFCRVAGRLAAREPRSDQLLRDALAATADIRAKPMALPSVGRDGTRYLAHIRPLQSSARRRAQITSPATSAVFVNEAALNARSLPETIAEAYKLTPAELRILLAIVEVGGVREVADALGVSESTVKTHLGRLFQKTATSRQAGLVSIVAGFSNPLLTEPTP